MIPFFAFPSDLRRIIYTAIRGSLRTLCATSPSNSLGGLHLFEQQLSGETSDCNVNDIPKDWFRNGMRQAIGERYA